MSQMQPFSLLFVGFVATTVYLLIVNQDVDGSAMGVMPGFSTASAAINISGSHIAKQPPSFARIPIPTTFPHKSAVISLNLRSESELLHMKRKNQEKTKIASSNNAAANVFSDENPAKLAIEIEIEEELQKLLEKMEIKVRFEECRENVHQVAKCLYNNEGFRQQQDKSEREKLLVKAANLVLALHEADRILSPKFKMLDLEKMDRKRLQLLLHTDQYTVLLGNNEIGTVLHETLRAALVAVNTSKILAGRKGNSGVSEPSSSTNFTSPLSKNDIKNAMRGEGGFRSGVNQPKGNPDNTDWNGF